MSDHSLTSLLAGLILLRNNCNNYTIDMRDWPRLGFAYTVRCTALWAYGSGVGRSLEQAATRALNDMRKRKAKLHTGGASPVNIDDIIDPIDRSHITAADVQHAKDELDRLLPTRDKCVFCCRTQPIIDDYKLLNIVNDRKYDLCHDGGMGFCIERDEMFKLVKAYRELRSV